MKADYPGAIVVEAATYGYPHKYRGNNWPRAWCLHTPEEKPDDYPGTPYYFHNLTGRQASTHYFVSFLGFVFQCVPEDAGAYANAVEGRGYPAWADPLENLNLQTLSIEIEGYAASIHQTMPRGSAQWNALVKLMAHRCQNTGIPVDRTFGHKDVSTNRSDPGQLDIQTLIADVKAEMEDAMTPEQEAKLDQVLAWTKEIWEYRQQNNDQHAAILAQNQADIAGGSVSATAQAVVDALVARLED